MRRSMLRPTRRNPYSASLGQSVLAFFQPSLAFAKASPATGAPPPLPMGVGTVTSDVAKVDAMGNGTFVLIGVKLAGATSMGLIPATKSGKWAAKTLEGGASGEPLPSLAPFCPPGMDCAILILRTPDSETGLTSVLTTLKAALGGSVVLQGVQQGTAAAALLAWFANSPFAAPPFSGKAAAAAAAAPAAAALPPGMMWVSPPFTSANIKAVATAYTGSSTWAAGGTDDEATELGSVLALYYDDGTRAFFQRVSNYNVRELDASTGQYADSAQTLGVYFSSPNGADTVAVLYMGDADPADDDPDAMAELLAKAPPNATSAPGYMPPTTPVSIDLQLLANKVMALVPGSVAVVPPSDPFLSGDGEKLPPGVPEVKDESLGLTLRAWFGQVKKGVHLLLYIGTKWQGDTVGFTVPLPATLTPAFYDSTAQFFADEINEVKAKKSLGPLSSAAPSTAPGAASAKAKKSEPGTQQVKSLTATTLKTLAPLVAKAVAPVVAVEVAGPLVLRWKGDTAEVKVGSIGKTGDVTLVAFRKGELVTSKPITLPLPDTANALASELAKQMVYLLAYVHETKGREVEKAPTDPPPTVTVDGVALLPGATLTTADQLAALPHGALLSAVSEGVGPAQPYESFLVSVPATLRYLPVENWDNYYQPLSVLTNMTKLAAQGVVVPQPKAPGWPPVPVAPTLALYSSLPIGTLLRSDVNQGTVWAARTASGDYQKVDVTTGEVTASTPRPPSKLVTDAASSGAAVSVVYVGKGTVEPPQTYLSWITGSDAAASQPEVAAATIAAQVTTLAAALGISPTIAALFTPQALQAMLAQKGIPYAGASFTPPLSAAAQSPLLLKNPSGGFRSNPSRYRDVVRQVLRNPNPTLRDLQDAELLEAAGLPLHECLPRRRNPKGGLAGANEQETGVIKGVADALKTVLGDGPRPKTGNIITQTIDTRASSMYGSGGGHARAEQNQFAQFLRYLVAARALGLWRKFIDPGARSVTRALNIDAAAINAGNGSIRANETTLSQIEAMKAAGALAVPTKMTQAMSVWLKRQAYGDGWTRTDVGEPWMPSNNLTPPSNYPGMLVSVQSGQEDAATFQHWNIFQAAEAMTFSPPYNKKDTYKGPQPYPKWAGEPWANVEGFAIDYYDSTFGKYTISEWSAPLWGFGPSPSMFYMRANTRDPRFVMLPGSSVSEGPMSNFRSEGAVLFCTVDDKPLKAEVVSMGLTVAGIEDFPRLKDKQLVAWGLARPAFPSGPKPTASSGPSFALPMKTNPTRVNAREVHAVLFSRAKWGPGAVRSWLAKNGMEGLAVEAAGGAWRVSVYAADAFYPGSIQRRAVADGVVILAGRPL